IVCGRLLGRDVAVPVVADRATFLSRAGAAVCPAVIADRNMIAALIRSNCFIGCGRIGTPLKISKKNRADPRPFCQTGGGWSLSGAVDKEAAHAATQRYNRRDADMTIEERI